MHQKANPHHHIYFHRANYSGQQTLAMTTEPTQLPRLSPILRLMLYHNLPVLFPLSPAKAHIPIHNICKHFKLNPFHIVTLGKQGGAVQADEGLSGERA